MPLHHVDFPDAAPTVYGSTIFSTHSDPHSDIDSVYNPSQASLHSSPGRDYTDLRVRLHQEELAVQALVEQTDRRPAQQRTTKTKTQEADIPVHRFGHPPPHWGRAEVAKLQELLQEFGTAWQAIWNDNYIGWTKGPKSDWIHPGRDAKKYRYKARNMKIQLMRLVSQYTSIHVYSTNVLG